MTACRHLEFHCNVDVHRVLKEATDEMPTAYMANIKIRCVDCDLPFEFVGCGCGLLFDRPMVSPSAEELHAPIVPGGQEHLLPTGLPGYSLHVTVGDGKVH